MALPGGLLVSASDVTRSFGHKVALDGVSLAVPAGHVHALLGRNGAGKTSLLRILTGLLTPTAGRVSVAGVDVAARPLAVRRVIGLVPSGDRSFYLRISGLENLVFFGRLHGLGRREARSRALASLAAVGLAEAARTPVGTYSHGMQKRLSVARALLTDPPVLLVDEATHDLDPEGAREVRRLVRAAADRGAAVLWATQRVDEIRELADRVTLLDEGRTRFAGTVAELLTHTPRQRYVLGLRNGASTPDALEGTLQRQLSTVGTILRRPEAEEFVLSLADGAILGDALTLLLEANVSVLSCRQETSDVEEAFVNLLREKT
jgi:ABC-2 type transport system ATP-binding protein